MTSPALKISEVLDAHVALFQSLTFAPLIVQEHGFDYYVANPNVELELPSLWVRPVDPVNIEIFDLAASAIDLKIRTRAIVAFEWALGTEYIDAKIAIAEEVATKYLGEAVDDSDTLMKNAAGTVGVDVLQCRPQQILLTPPEQAQVSQSERDPIAVLAVVCETMTRGNRR